jgi:hypothetical protein
MASVTKSYYNTEDENTVEMELDMEDENSVEMEVDIEEILLETPENPIINFDFISDESTRTMIETAYNAVNQLELWDYMQSHQGSFMFSGNRNVDRIYNRIEELGYTGHSGASFGITLQTIKFIADHGFQAFRHDYLN